MIVINDIVEVDPVELLNNAVLMNPIQTEDLDQALAQMLNSISDLSDQQRREAWDQLTASEFLVNFGRDVGVGLPNALVEGFSGDEIYLSRVADDTDLTGPDGKPLELICLVLSSSLDKGRHVKVLAELHRLFQRSDTRARVLKEMERLQESENEPVA